MTTAVVWLKRDLRMRDHAPLAAAAQHDGALALYVIEPAWLASPEFAKQAADHAPEGVFVRRWIPEFGTAACPRPIVDERAPSARAQQRPAALRATPEAHAEADAVQQRHGSRKSGLPPSGMHRRKSTANPTQGERF